MLCGGDWGLSVKQSDAADTSGRLVSVVIDVREKERGRRGKEEEIFKGR